MQQDATQSSGSILSALAILALILFLTIEGLRPPAPRPVDADPKQFSAERASAILDRLVGDGIPHPTGSPQNDTVRARVISEFTKIGYTPTVQEGFACDDEGDCATVKNVLARLEGSENGPAVLLAAHYDSVPAGPGAFDDGAGAASVLEIARAFKSLPQPRHPLIFLIDDGEEAGLLGARVFVNEHPWAKDVHVAVNVDSRGTSGASLMFETGAANEWALRAYARRAARPETSSIFYEAYRRFPNDTDFTVFKAAGYQGVNFANIDRVLHYHTPLDSFANADPATLQHQGDNALSSVETFANLDISNPAPGEAVYFDVFGHWIISWPARQTLKIAVGSALLLFIEIAWLIYGKRLSALQFFWGAAAWLLTMVATGILAWVLNFVLRRIGATESPWIAHPLPAQICFWCVAIAVVSFMALRFAPRSGPLGLWAGVSICWATLSIAVASQVPAIGYVLQCTTCAAAAGGLLLAFRSRHSARGVAIAVTLPLALAATLGFAPVILIYQGFGNLALPAISVLVALLFTPIAPMGAEFSRVRQSTLGPLLWTAWSIAALCAFFAIVVPVSSAKAPEHVNLEYVQETDSGKSQWVVYPASGRLPEPIRLATNYRRQDTHPFSWSSQPAFVVSAPHLDLAPPTFTIQELSEETGQRRYRALLRSERGASEAAVLFPPDCGIESVTAEDQTLEPESDRVRRELNGWFGYEFWAVPAKGIEIGFTLPAGKSVEVFALDVTYGLPQEGQFLLKARPLTATPFGNGDRTIVTRRVELLP
ncbi:MAG: M20/M25/M40 family metallo-hydrolase [Candidatus Acidiferrales bacterium]